MIHNQGRLALFLSEAVEAAGRLTRSLLAKDNDQAARAAFTLSTAAALFDLAPLRHLGLLVRGATTLQEPPSEELAALLLHAARLAEDYLRTLSDHPDSGEVLDPPKELLAILSQIDPHVPRAEVAFPASDPLQQRRRPSPPSPEPRATLQDFSMPEIFTPLVEEDMLEPFLDEAAERLEALSHKLVQLEQRPRDAELIRDIFRDLHTLKGSSGFVGLRSMNRLAHAAEDLVSQLRAGTRHADRPVVDALLSGLDGLRQILNQATKRLPIQVDLSRLLTRLADPSLVLGAPKDLPAGQAPASLDAQGERRTLRVDFDKLDVLLNLVGELIVGKSHLRSVSDSIYGLVRELAGELRRERRRMEQGAIQPRLHQIHRRFEELAQKQMEDVAALDHVAAELRDQVMRLRMVPIGRVFTKHHRTVRELCRQLGKSATLSIVGAETELDKMVVEQLDDPLLHLLRNAVDHGLEDSAGRLALGKSPQGQIRLNSYHRGNQILVEVSDDGRGIDPEVVRQRAVERGLLSQEDAQALDRNRTLELILRPGFSTAVQVSDVSGRGVGMDVVAQAVLRLKGSLSIHSELGQGTTFLMSLPLTLAIIQVLLVEVAGECYALPMESILRVVNLEDRESRWLCEEQVLLMQVASAGGEPTDTEVPLYDLQRVLEVEGDTQAAPLCAILVEQGGSAHGLLCARQLGKQEIVVKTLGELLERVPCVSGATLIGDRVVLLLDLPQLLLRGQFGRASQSARPSGSQKPEPTEAASPRRAARILVAEDSAVEREALCRLLRQHGYEVSAAEDGQIAARLAESDEPGFDLLSTDVTMPNLDGYELTRRVRHGDRQRDIPILMLSGRSEPIDRVRGFDAGVDEYLTKPVDPEEYLRAVRTLLARYSGEARKLRRRLP